METVIRVESLSKKYLIGRQRKESYVALRDVVAEKFKDFFNGLRRGLKNSEANQSGNDKTEEIWALRDVSFEIKQGEKVGIIGANGAGKTTLLKILSRITEPTKGVVKMRGRVSSLLEVGTGFHPELTGRENIFLNGAILGMSKARIRNNFDKIVNFAELAKFIDTPVKRYSSGMYIRLAFAVASQLDSEILLVDEVLAVGDYAFQKKCLGKMKEITEEGRTVLFVSHNMSAIQGLCPRAVWIDGGKIQFDGESEVAVAKYLSQAQAGEKAQAILRSQQGEIEIERVITKNKDGKITDVFRPGESITIEIQYFARQPQPAPYLWVYITTQSVPLFAANMVMDGVRPDEFSGRGQISCKFTELPLMPKQVYGIVLGGRYADNMTTAFNNTEVAQLRITGTAREIGFEGELAESVLGGGINVLVPYEWKLQDGRTIFIPAAAVK